MACKQTDKWLTGQGEDKQARLLAVAREKGSFLRKNHQQQEKIVSLKVREQILENKRLKKEKEKKTEMQLTLMRAVIEHGGLCESKQDVMKLKRKLKAENVDQKTIKETLKN